MISPAVLNPAASPIKAQETAKGEVSAQAQRRGPKERIKAPSPQETFENMFGQGVVPGPQVGNAVAPNPALPLDPKALNELSNKSDKSHKPAMAAGTLKAAPSKFQSTAAAASGIQARALSGESSVAHANAPSVAHAGAVLVADTKNPTQNVAHKAADDLVFQVLGVNEPILLEDIEHVDAADTVSGSSDARRTQPAKKTDGTPSKTAAAAVQDTQSFLSTRATEPSHRDGIDVITDRPRIELQDVPVTTRMGRDMDLPLMTAAPALTATPLAGRSAQHREPLSLTGDVVKGAGARDRFSSVALAGISGGIQGLSDQGGGEMRISLKPDNLGDLRLRVITRGNQVSLQVLASNPASKRVIEDSLDYLKESLQSKHLVIGKIEIGLIGAQALAQPGHSPTGDFASTSQNPASSSNWDGGQGAGQDYTRDNARENAYDRWDRYEQTGLTTAKRGSQNAAPTSRQDARSIDVRI